MNSYFIVPLTNHCKEQLFQKMPKLFLNRNIKIIDLFDLGILFWDEKQSELCSSIEVIYIWNELGMDEITAIVR